MRTIDISDLPELLAVVREVQQTGTPRVLSANGEEMAVIAPAKDGRRRKATPTSDDDPLWRIVGTGHAEGAGDISENVDRYLAVAKLSKLQ